ncbi:MAG: cytochrome P460 family protein [Terracidiphilus sp.]|jgi:hypothetical protein
MLTITKTLLLLSLAALTVADVRQDTATQTLSPEYTNDAQLKFPEHYREWVFLSSGLDMSYTARAAGDMNDFHSFDNVFVNPEAYQAFLKTGTWPDKTMMVLENRKGQQKGSINQQGRFQTALLGVEVHVKDEAHFPGKWAFFAFDPHDKSSTMIPTAAACYSCHAQHAAVDTTFTQFYPTLLPIAKSKGTLSAGYLKEIEAAAQEEPHQ